MIVVISCNISAETYLKCDSGKKKFSVEKLLNDQIKVKKIKPRIGKYKESDGVWARAEPQDQDIYFYLFKIGDTKKGERKDRFEGMDMPEAFLKGIGEARWEPAPDDTKNICSYYLGHTNKIPPVKESWGEGTDYFDKGDNCFDWEISTTKYQYYTKSHSFDSGRGWFEWMELNRESLRFKFEILTSSKFLNSTQRAYCSLSTKEEFEEIRKKYQEFLVPFKNAETQSLKKANADAKAEQKI